MVTVKQLLEAQGFNGNGDAPVLSTDLIKAITRSAISQSIPDFQSAITNFATNFIVTVPYHDILANLANLNLPSSVGLSVSYGVSSEPSQSVGADLMDLQDTTDNPLEVAAQETMRKFRAFYSELTDEYEQALAQSGKKRNRKLEFAHGVGATRLADLQTRLNVTTEQQLTRLQNVLSGLRQVAASTTDVAGRGSLLVRIAEDLERRFTRFQLVQQVQPPTRGRVAHIGGNTAANLPAIAA